MQFLITAYDGNDDQAMQRRMDSRDAHLKGIDQLQKTGQMLFGAALLDDEGKMIGSTIICEFETRQVLDKWLETEPYVTAGVWQKIQVQPCKVAPSFIGLQKVQTVS